MTFWNPSEEDRHWLVQVGLEDDVHPEFRNRDSIEFTWYVGTEPGLCTIWSVMVLDNGGVPRLCVFPPRSAEIMLYVDELIGALRRARATLTGDTSGLRGAPGNQTIEHGDPRHALLNLALEDHDHPELRNRASVEFAWEQTGWSAMVLDNDDIPRLIVPPEPYYPESMLYVDKLIELLIKAKARLTHDRTVPW